MELLQRLFISLIFMKQFCESIAGGKISAWLPIKGLELYILWPSFKENIGCQIKRSFLKI